MAQRHKDKTVKEPETDPPVVGVAVYRGWFVWRDILETSKEKKIESSEHLWLTENLYYSFLYFVSCKKQQQQCIGNVNSVIKLLLQNNNSLNSIESVQTLVLLLPQRRALVEQCQRQI